MSQVTASVGKQWSKAHRAALIWRSLHELKPLLAQRVIDRSAISRARFAWGNPHWSSSVEFIIDTVRACDETRVGIVECGSGLTTAVIALTVQQSQRPFVTLEHDAEWTARTLRRLRFSGIRNVQVLHRGLERKNGWLWYGVTNEDLPGSIDLVVCDGPPGHVEGGRSGMLAALRPNLVESPTILLDDVDRASEQRLAQRWADELGLAVSIAGPDEFGRTHALICPG